MSTKHRKTKPESLLKEHGQRSLAIQKFLNSVLNFISSRLFLKLTFLWFIFQAIFMAISTKFGIPPDEIYHYNFIKLFVSNGWLPFIHNQSGYYSLGEVVHTPFFLYHYLLSIPAHFFGDFHTVLLLRFINIFMAVASLYLLCRIVTFIRLPKLVRNLSVFMLSNTLMFVFLSSSINYDNLFILLSLSSVLLLLQILQKFTLTRIILLMTLLLAGLLTKVNFLPVAFIIVIILAWSLRHKVTYLMEDLRKTPIRWRWQNVILIIVLLLTLSLFFQRYTPNLAHYHTYEPKCRQTLTFAQCSQNGIFVRNEAIEKRHPGSATKSAPEYIVSWSFLMSDRIYGIFAHKTAEPTKLIKFGAPIFFLLAIVALIRKYIFRDKSMSILLAITLFYALVLVLDNYKRYHRFGIFSFAVQGRYLFAALPLLYVIGNTYILSLLRNKLPQLIFAASAILIFLTASLPSYIYTTTDDWHNNETLTINKDLKKIMEKILP